MNIINSMSVRSIKGFLILVLPVLILNSCGQIKKQNESNKEWLTNQKEFIQTNEQFKSKFENKITNIYEIHQLSGDFLLAVVNEKGLAYSFAMNRNILSKNPTTLDNNSPIYIASHTKSFTGTLLKILEEKGKVDLDKSIYEYLPELTYGDSIDTKQITVSQLLNHTHGTHSTRFTWKTAFLGYNGGNQELIKDLNSDFKYDPSHQFRYSNIGPILAAMIAEKVTGNGWKDEVAKRIFHPLNMNSTSGNVSDFETNEIRPVVTISKDNQIFQSGFYKEDVTMHASGGIISTINDLTKWLQANITHDQRLLNTDNAWKELHKPTTSQDRTFFTYKRYGYSLGWDIATYQNDTILTRFGGYAGISFHISFIPSKKIGIIAFSSDSRATYLTHLAANYAYNTINHLPEVEDIFEKEKQLFDKSYERNNNRPLPAADDKMKQSKENNILIGHYENDLAWPDISISKNDSTYLMKWGLLKGSIYKMPDPKRPYLAALGALTRTFNIKADSLFTGSLIYTRQEAKQ